MDDKNNISDFIKIIDNYNIENLKKCVINEIDNLINFLEKSYFKNYTEIINEINNMLKGLHYIHKIYSLLIFLHTKETQTNSIDIYGKCIESFMGRFNKFELEFYEVKKEILNKQIFYNVNTSKNKFNITFLCQKNIKKYNDLVEKNEIIHTIMNLNHNITIDIIALNKIKILLNSINSTNSKNNLFL